MNVVHVYNTDIHELVEQKSTGRWRFVARGEAEGCLEAVMTTSGPVSQDLKSFRSSLLLPCWRALSN